jgi:hypothetical protein
MYWNNRKIYNGKRGGKYVIVKGNKRYVPKGVKLTRRKTPSKTRSLRSKFGVESHKSVPNKKIPYTWYNRVFHGRKKTKIDERREERKARARERARKMRIESLKAYYKFIRDKGIAAFKFKSRPFQSTSGWNEGFQSPYDGWFSNDPFARRG